MNVVFEELKKRKIRASTSRNAYITFLTEKFGLDENGDFNNIDLDKLTEEEKIQYDVLKEARDMDSVRSHAVTELVYDNASPDKRGKAVLVDRPRVDSTDAHSILYDGISVESGKEVIYIGDKNIELPEDLKDKTIEEQVEYYKKLVKDTAVPGNNGIAKDYDFSRLCDEALELSREKDKQGIDFGNMLNSDEEFEEYVSKSNTDIKSKEDDLIV